MDVQNPPFQGWALATEGKKIEAIIHFKKRSRALWDNVDGGGPSES